MTSKVFQSPNVLFLVLEELNSYQNPDEKLACTQALLINEVVVIQLRTSERTVSLKESP